MICLLLGSTTAMPSERIVALHGTPADYQDKYAAAVDAAIEAGYVLAEDRAAIETYEHAELVPE